MTYATTYNKERTTWNNLQGARNDPKRPESTYNEQETTWNDLKRPATGKEQPETIYNEQETIWNDLKWRRNETTYNEQ